ncbi:lysyl oxidase family protein [Longimicrobium sp.]|uniref:lysyl oxidase family protein n=1 Tax=Longimicrobium sp. TaxID=2029185 RepID=UPI002BF580F3|nr:lysyl oxidase family protein [Longimicrobium sp.]HSU16538.1 lysyl oxidase family protein [Longimicrobium sp.]
MNGRKMVAALLAAAALAACEGPRTALTSPAPGSVRAGRAQDLDGMANLVVDAAKLASSWVITHENLAPNLCSVQEGDVPPGDHYLLRFTVTTPNIGDADVFIGDPREHIDPNGDGSYADSDGLYEFAACHHHFHFRNYAKYELFPVRADGSLGTAIKARKRGFCMIDTTPFNNNNGGTTPWVYRNCGTPESAGFQGISVGYADTYVKALGGQYFVLDDPAEPAPPGEYILRITVNPGFPQTAGEPCLFKDTHGLCHNFPESSYDDNVGQIRLTIPDRTGKTGGTIKTAEDGIDDENRPTQ